MSHRFRLLHFLYLGEGARVKSPFPWIPALLCATFSPSLSVCLLFSILGVPGGNSICITRRLIPKMEPIVHTSITSLCTCFGFRRY